MNLYIFWLEAVCCCYTIHMKREKNESGVGLWRRRRRRCSCLSAFITQEWGKVREASRKVEGGVGTKEKFDNGEGKGEILRLDFPCLTTAAIFVLSLRKYPLIQFQLRHLTNEMSSAVVSSLRSLIRMYATWWWRVLCVRKKIGWNCLHFLLLPLTQSFCVVSLFSLHALLSSFIRFLLFRSETSRVWPSASNLILHHGIWCLPAIVRLDWQLQRWDW